jgi:hypothetical protein
MHQAINDGAAIELSAHCIENQTCVNRKGYKGTLGNLEGMRTFKNGHAQLDLGVTGCRQASNLNRNQILWDKENIGHLHRIGRGHHSDNEQVLGWMEHHLKPHQSGVAKSKQDLSKTGNCDF